MHRIRLLCVPAMRTSDENELRIIDELLSNEIGLYRSYCSNADDGILLLRTLTPGWGIASITEMGIYHRVELMDHTGRNRPMLSNKFVHPCLNYIIVYMAVTAHLIDVATRLDELTIL